MSKYRHTSKRIKELEEEIKGLNKSLDYFSKVNSILQNNYNNAEKQLANNRKIIKYQTLQHVVMNLLSAIDSYDDLTSIIKNNIMEYYKRINLDMMKINDDEEYDDEAEGYNESESSDIWDGEEEFE